MIMFVVGEAVLLEHAKLVRIAQASFGKNLAGTNKRGKKLKALLLVLSYRTRCP